jgi:2-oxo-4-hydroxy-4-carboxy--5-ureidoimidazoline (OHCU) decarboxylase
MHSYDISFINRLSPEELQTKFARLSGSKKWVFEMLSRHPFSDADQLLGAAAKVWWDVCDREDWIESFNSRPVIGDQESFIKDKWCQLEDEHTIQASKKVADELIRCNAPYQKKFGYAWILLCEGLTPAEQLANYKRRIDNDVRTELVENSLEDFKVTVRRLRLCLQCQDPYNND